MLKKVILVVWLVVIALFFGYIHFFTGMGSLPEGELMGAWPSPAGTHTVNAYLCRGNATTADAVRAEVVTGAKKRNIYWQYREDTCDCRWLDEDVISINGVTLNVLKDTYDWRSSKPS